MICETTDLDGALLVATNTERIDMSNADDFTEVLLETVSLTLKVVIVDLSSVEYISSAGLRSLMIAFRAAKSEQKTLAIASLRALTREIFAISRFDIVFTLFDTVRDAIVSLAPGSLAKFDAQ